MKKNNSRRFPALMMISLLILSPVFLFKVHSAQAAGGRESDRKESGSLPEVSTQPQDAAQPNNATQPQGDAHPEENTEQGAAFLPEENTWPEASEQWNASSQESVTSEGNSGEQTLTDFFSHTLFIGDSRTVGLMEYAGLETPDFYASSGMSLFKMWEKEMEVPGMGKMTLQELLEQKTYDRIFLMTGINELGYAHSAILKKYAEAAEIIQNLQPQAKLYLCANLHVTGSRSDRDDMYNNANIDWLNGEIAGIAGNCGAGFLDVNPLFDDESGALRSDYSGDETHPYGKYYQEWGEWLFETCKKAETPTDTG